MMVHIAFWYPSGHGYIKYRLFPGRLEPHAVEVLQETFLSRYSRHHFVIVLHGVGHFESEHKNTLNFGRLFHISSFIV